MLSEILESKMRIRLKEASKMGQVRSRFGKSVSGLGGA